MEVFATINKNKTQLAIFAMNWIPGGAPIKDETVDIVISDLGQNGKISSGELHRIDESNCNPYVIWQKQGEPTYPTLKQINEMKNASIIIPESINSKSVNSDTVSFNFDLPMYGTALLIVDL